MFKPHECSVNSEKPSMIHHDPVPPVSFRASVRTGREVLQQQELIRSLAQHVSHDNAEGIKELLCDDTNTSAIVEAIGESPFSSLHYAVARNKTAALTVLIDKLPLTVWNLKTLESGQTPLMLAAEQGNHEMALQLFLRLHTYVSERKRDLHHNGDTQLRALAKVYGCRGDETSVDQSVWQRIVNARDREGNTPLLLAVKNGHLACCNMFLALTADPEIRNQRGESARSLVLQQPVGSEMRLLLDGTGPAHEQVYPVRIRRAVQESPHHGGLTPIRFARTPFPRV
ncbi:hypothetical protein GOQ28_08265 [Bordetella sp. 02P26C-1]|nr:hypothetical protein [Bordetella sp. 02P26C-1]